MHTTPILTPTILLCPGQGAQAVGMGKAWFDASPAAQALYAEAAQVLGFDLAKLSFEGPAEVLNKTDSAQAAIYTASVAAYRGLVEKGLLKAADIQATAGLSLGEFTALHLAGAFSFADGLALVRLRGQAMQAAAEAGSGTMVALTGDGIEAAAAGLCDQARQGGILVPANYNSPMQMVASGDPQACARVAEAAGAAGFKATPLTVAGAFHSDLMKPAAEKLAAALEQTAWNLPSASVLSNVSGVAHPGDIAAIKQSLIAQLTSPVRWSQSMQWAAANLPGRYVELAPGKVLSGLMRRTVKELKVENFDAPPAA